MLRTVSGPRRERADTAAGVMSGGEQQMLTICRTLMGDPELVMIDEPTEGLAPKIVEQVGDRLPEIAEARRCDPAGRAEAHDRDADFAAGLRDGPRPDRVRGNAGGPRRKRAVRKEWLEDLGPDLIARR